MSESAAEKGVPEDALFPSPFRQSQRIPLKLFLIVFLIAIKHLYAL